jgi:hypothetical protein
LVVSLMTALIHATNVLNLVWKPLISSVTMSTHGVNRVKSVYGGGTVNKMGLLKFRNASSAVRTHDLLLTKETPYHLAIDAKFTHRDSNPG